MLITFLAEHVLGQPRPPPQAHLLSVEETEIDCLADVAVGFSPRFSDFKNLKRGKLKAAPVKNLSYAFEQLGAIFERTPAPSAECSSSGLHRSFCFGDAGLDHCAHHLMRTARINRRNRFASPDTVAANYQRVFLA